MIVYPTQNLMDYFTLSLGETNTILLPELPEGVTFDFKHGFLQMLESNMFSGAAHEEPMYHLRKFIKLINTTKQNHLPLECIRLYAFPFSLNWKT